MFTARYALSPYIKQIRFVFKGLNGLKGAQTNHAPRLMFARRQVMTVC
jgi:hypothetical protein